jgi:aspartate-semialdehyde dehydrogenase
LAEPVIALIGPDTLLGREIRDQLSVTKFEADVRLLTEVDEDLGKLTDVGGEPSVLTHFTTESLEGASAIVLAGSQEAARKVSQIPGAVPIVDLAGFLEDQPRARLRAPLLEPHDFRVAPDAIQIIAHPAAIALALVLTRIHQVFPIRRSVITVFEPASERGTAGIEELQEQTVNLLAFKPLPKKVYDAQLSYSMLAQYGEEAPLALADIEARIERHLATLLSLSQGAPIPSLRLIQAPVFHGYSFSLWLEFETNPGVAALQQILNEPPVEIHGSDIEPPNNVSSAGQTGVAVGAISIDRNEPRAVWMWMASDNLRLVAENAILVLKEVI